MEMIPLLQRMPLFAGFSQDELRMIAQIIKQQRYARNRVIIRAEERGAFFFVDRWSRAGQRRGEPGEGNHSRCLVS
jgi:hypothetical protein